MASDLKIEIFAYHCYYRAWQNFGVKDNEVNILDIYGDECIKVDNYSEACDDIFITGIDCRLSLFLQKFWDEFDYEKAIGWKYLYEFYDYVICICDRDDLFGYLTVFERMLATCGFVLNLCVRIYEYSRIDVVRYGHIIWAMYFDKFIETFYEEGGWKELRRISEKYIPISNFFSVFVRNDKESYLHTIKNASENYFQFLKALKKENCELKRKESFHISNLWIKFHLKDFKEYVRLPLILDESTDYFEIEMLLENLKFILFSWNYDDDYFKITQEHNNGAICSSSKLHSKTSDNCDNMKTEEHICIENLKNNKTFSNEFVNSKNVLVKHVECAFSRSSEKKSVNKIQGKIEIRMTGNVSDRFLDIYSPEECNNLLESLDTKFDTSKEYSPPTADSVLYYKINNLFSGSEKVLDDIFSRNDNLQCKIPDIGNVLSSDLKEETEFTRRHILNNLNLKIDPFSKNEASKNCNEDEIPKSALKPSVCSKNEENCNEDNNINSTICTNKTFGTPSEKNAMPKIFSSSNDIPTVYGITKNIDRGINTIKELDKFREEQNDPDIRNVLRMIQVLGDKQGIQYVCGTLRNRKDQNNLQVKSNKRKKRSKRKY